MTRRALLLAALAGCPKKDPPRAPDAEPPAADAGVDVLAEEPAAPPPLEPRPIGPYEIPFDGKRNVYYVVPASRKTPARLIANLHGVCNPPGYACGYWVHAASRHGFLICPEGNARCGPDGPPTWKQSFPEFDEDLERAIAAVDAHYPTEIGREGAVLTGFSLGAYAAAHIAQAHPGRWPYLILTEANVPLDAAALRKAGIRAVAMIAGELGSQAAGEKKTVDRLVKQGFRAKYWSMKGAGHHYSADIDTIMSEALEFVTSADAER